MSSDRDVYATAKLFMRQHGEHAALEAAARADALLESGDPQGSAVWERIVKAISELERREPEASNTVH